MTGLSLPLDALEHVQRAGKRMIKVPWDTAARFHERLLALGVRSTLHLEPGSREAYLDLWEKLEPEQVRSLLAQGQAA
jgi:hypothetical protein